MKKSRSIVGAVALVAALTNAGMLRRIITLHFDSATLGILVWALLCGTLAATDNKRIHMAIPFIMLLSGFLVKLLN